MNTILLVFYLGGQVVSSHSVAPDYRHDAYTACQIRGQAVVDGVNLDMRQRHIAVIAAFACQPVIDGVISDGE